MKFISSTGEINNKQYRNKYFTIIKKSVIPTNYRFSST